MYFIVGLGNPGKKYEKTRHNLGKMVIGKISHMRNFANIGRGVGGRGGWKGMVEIIRLRGFMNESGERLRQWIMERGQRGAGKKEKREKKGRDAPPGRLYKFAPPGRLYGRRLIVVHDDIDLPLGKIRIQWNGGSGGHKGVQSIIDNLGTKEFWRVKLGIGRPDAAGKLAAARTGLSEKRGGEEERYVLAEFKKEELVVVESMVEKAASALLLMIERGAGQAMNKFNN